MAQKKKFFLVSTKCKGLEFQIVNLNRESMMATLQGETGIPFDTSIKQDVLDNLGYMIDMRMVEVPDAPVHSEQAAA